MLFYAVTEVQCCLLTTKKTKQEIYSHSVDEKSEVKAYCFLKKLHISAEVYASGGFIVVKW